MKCSIRNLPDAQKAELNQWLHEHVMMECWHDWQVKGPSPEEQCYRVCKKCGDEVLLMTHWFGEPQNPDYCGDANLIRKVEQHVFRNAGIGDFEAAVSWLYDGPYFRFETAYFMPMEQRAVVCKLVSELMGVHAILGGRSYEDKFRYITDRW